MEKIIKQTTLVLMLIVMTFTSGCQIQEPAFPATFGSFR